MTKTSAQIATLLVSNHPDELPLIANQLRGIGFSDIHACSNAQDALELATKHRFSLIIVHTEVAMMETWDFVRLYKTDKAIYNAPIILYGKPNQCPISEEYRLEFGVQSYVNWPINTKPLMQAISQSIEDIQTSGTRENQYSVAKNALITKNSEFAITQYCSILDQFGNSVRGSFGLAQSFAQDNQLEKAQSIIEDITERDNTFIPALLLDFDTKLSAVEHEKALATLESTLKRAQTSPQFFLAALKISLDHHAWEYTNQICDAADKAGFESIEIPLARAKIALGQGDTKESLKLTIRAEKAFKITLETLNLKAVCYKRRDSYPLAIDSYKAALAIDPRNSRLLFNYGLCLLAVDDNLAAKKAFEMALSIDPHYDKARQKLDTQR